MVHAAGTEGRLGEQPYVASPQAVALDSSAVSCCLPQCLPDTTLLPASPSRCFPDTWASLLTAAVVVPAPPCRHCSCKQIPLAFVPASVSSPLLFHCGPCHWCCH
ncbi:hypothetical protein BGW80DRAFT_510119 [Lactifluus volemus]|nr:hypothetical protein BGW80DRAFT_510119 [Lactifluus volemus]